MDELISRNYLLNRVYETNNRMGYYIHVVDARDIQLAPAVDAVPVVHGRWIKYGMDIPEHPWHCSECGWSNHHIEQCIVQEFKWCPECGAKMDLEE